MLWLAVLGWVASLALHVSALLGGTEDGLGFPVLLVGGFIVCLPAFSIQGMLVETRTASQIQWFKALSVPAWMKWV